MFKELVGVWYLEKGEMERRLEGRQASDHCRPDEPRGELDLDPED